MPRDWQSACRKLWGEDWIAPLSDVLGVNRRTVERWKSGMVPIPKETVSDIMRMSLRAKSPAYGEALRRMAKGEDITSIVRWAMGYQQATEQIMRDVGEIPTVARAVRGKHG